MIVRAAFAATLLFAAQLGGPAQAKDSPVQHYRGVVTGVGGPHASAFRIGEPIRLSYMLNRRAVDTDSDPVAGSYQDGLHRLMISLPESRFSLVAGEGSVSVFNDVSGPSDQVFFLTYDVARSTSLQGYPVTAVDLEYIDFSPAPDGRPEMIRSDALPLHPLHGDEDCAMLGTALGWTSVCFAAHAD